MTFRTQVRLFAYTPTPSPGEPREKRWRIEHMTPGGWKVGNDHPFTSRQQAVEFIGRRPGLDHDPKDDAEG